MREHRGRGRRIIVSCTLSCSQDTMLGMVDVAVIPGALVGYDWTARALTHTQSRAGSEARKEASCHTNYTAPSLAPSSRGGGNEVCRCCCCARETSTKGRTLGVNFPCSQMNEERGRPRESGCGSNADTPRLSLVPLGSQT